jgi:NAD kinase
MVPRTVLVQRPTEWSELLARHGTREQVRFFLRTRDIDPDEVERRHHAFLGHRHHVLGAIPGDWRRASVQRDDLERFLFEPGDIVVVLGQDGLVANVAKYLDGQPLIGLNPDPERIAGILVAHPPAAAADLLRDVGAARHGVQARTMTEARLDDGQRLCALNEIFVGHRSHQSARYTLHLGERSERQSSSGLIFATGTGATGWAKSINGQFAEPVALPAATDRALAWFAREPWTSPATGSSLSHGLIAADQSARITCELTDGATAFGDGIEADALTIDWGQTLTVGVAPQALQLVA